MKSNGRKKNASFHSKGDPDDDGDRIEEIFLVWENLTKGMETEEKEETRWARYGVVMKTWEKGERERERQGKRLLLKTIIINRLINMGMSLCSLKWEITKANFLSLLIFLS